MCVLVYIVVSIPCIPVFNAILYEYFTINFFKFCMFIYFSIVFQNSHTFTYTIQFDNYLFYIKDKIKQQLVVNLFILQIYKIQVYSIFFTSFLLNNIFNLLHFLTCQYCIVFIVYCYYAYIASQCFCYSIVNCLYILTKKHVSEIKKIYLIENCDI